MYKKDSRKQSSFTQANNFKTLLKRCCSLGGAEMLFYCRQAQNNSTNQYPPTFLKCVFTATPTKTKSRFLKAFLASFGVLP